MTFQARIFGVKRFAKEQQTCPEFTISQQIKKSLFKILYRTLSIKQCHKLFEKKRAEHLKASTSVKLE